MFHKVQVGESYKCGNCKTILEKKNYLRSLFKPISINKLIKECPNCHKKFITHYSFEFFNLNILLFCTNLLKIMISWFVLIYFVYDTLLSSFWPIINDNFLVFCVTYAILFFLLYIIRWNLAIKKSKERMNDSEYLLDLLKMNILIEAQVIEFYKQGIITKEIYDEVITKKHQKVKESLEKLKKITEKMNEENNEKKKNINENLLKQMNTKNTKKKHCTECGVEIEPYWKFCHECGNKLQ